MRKPAPWIAYALIGFIAVWYSPAFAADARSAGATVVGEWKEHWGTPGQTDVTYHDQYRVTRASDDKVTVEILNRKQTIEDEQLKQRTLTFTQHTDTYVVKYSLTLQQDGKWMNGTATTPEKVVNVKWERTE